ncbi:alpha-amylase family glycosyl hydrolase [Pedobacter immunditicola]|uniref:alpha-amylase family glycosyl hydrolase n=1 Tax=Pedobacter immunditicola TaxID=3133440 RepID=UPI00309F9C22
MKRFHIALLILAALATACQKSSLPPGEIVSPVTGQPASELPAGAKEGVVYLNNGSSAIVTLYAPSKSTVALIGDFNDWQSTKNPMKNTADGKTWWVQLDNLDPAKEYAYQFLVDNDLRVADPYTEKVLDPQNDSFISATVYPGLKAYPTGKTTGIVSVMQGLKPAYSWKNTAGFKRPDQNNLVIYELLIRDFTAGHDYASTLQKLDYLVALGINAIELMPVNEFEGNLSWGYNPSFYFAPDKYYGTKTALQNFIDECHGRGIAVILDMVLNHSFGQSPMVQLYFDKTSKKPNANSPWYNADATHPFNVGYDFNHDKPETQAFVKNVIKFWMEEYKVDGFRFDLSKGFTQKKSTDDAVFRVYDAARVALWKEYNNYIKTIDNKGFYVILEHFADVQEEKALAAEGMMLWNNINYAMNEATMGWLDKSDFNWGFYTRHELSKPDQLVTYMQSHDEERTMYKNISYGNTAGNYNVKELATGLQREKLAAAFFMMIPGPKMMWQFQELGYDVSIDFNGRTGDKPIRWEYAQDEQRKALYEAYARLIRLKKQNAVFNSADAVFSLSGPVKFIKLTHASNTVFVIGNYDVVSQMATIDMGSGGTWFEAGTNTPVDFATRTYSKLMLPGEYHIFSKTALIN